MYTVIVFLINVDTSLDPSKIYGLHGSLFVIFKQDHKNKYRFFSFKHNIFDLNKFKSIEIMQSFSNYKGIKLEIN